MMLSMMFSAQPSYFKWLGIVIVMPVRVLALAHYAWLADNTTFSNRTLKLSSRVQFLFSFRVFHSACVFRVSALPKFFNSFLCLAQFISLFLRDLCLRIMHALLARTRIATLLTGSDIERFNRQDLLAAKTPSCWTNIVLVTLMSLSSFSLRRNGTATRTPHHFFIWLRLGTEMIKRKFLAASRACLMFHNYNYTTIDVLNQAMEVATHPR